MAQVQVNEAVRTALVPAWMVAPEAPLQPGLGVDDRDEDAIKAQVWPRAFEQWIAGGWRSHGTTISEETRHAYQVSVDEFQGFIGRYPMWRVMGSQVIAWQNAMRARHLSEATINLRLAALSSLYEFVCNQFPFPDPRNGRTEMFLCNRNPVKSVKRTKIDPIRDDKTVFLSFDEITAMLHRIDRSNVPGLRDYALLVTLFLTSQRSSAIGSLRWGDIAHPKNEQDVIRYSWTSKGKSGTNELLREAYEAICAYLRAAGRLSEGMSKEDFIFQPLSDVGTRMAQRKAEKAGRTPPAPRIGSTHLSGARINQIVKRAAARAGLDESKIHTHITRHSSTVWMLENGVPLEEVQKVLHHSSIGTTMIYAKGFMARKDRHPMWKSVGNFFAGLE